MDHSEWENFWKDQRQSFQSVMQISTAYFASRLEALSLIKPTDTILDYGCGPGFFSDYFAGKDNRITGVDINDFFISQSKKNHPGSSFVLITTDTSENESILKNQLGGKRFDVILLLSIAQYFKDEKTLDQTVALLKPYLSDSGKLILADIIDENTSSIRDALSVLSLCIRKNKTIAFIRFMTYLLFSNYHDISKKEKLLKFSESTISQIASANHLTCKKIQELTPHPTRTNYVLQKQ
jgi:2-polyprenyl-3-methyl-5-hydroxy-6-metoxy-1,4-benzoquinol methylase